MAIYHQLWFWAQHDDDDDADDAVNDVQVPLPIIAIITI